MRCGRAQIGGYSLMELMVASVGAMAIAVAVVGLSKMSETTMHGESRIARADADLRDVASMLRNDFARAGYMSSPWARVGMDPLLVGTHSDGDTRLGVLTRPPVGLNSLACVNPIRGLFSGNYASAPGAGGNYCTVANYNRLASVRYFAGGSRASDLALSTANGIVPDAVILSGNYASADDYFVRGIDSATSPPRAIVTFGSASGGRLFLNRLGLMDTVRYPTGGAQASTMVSALFLAPNTTATSTIPITGMYRLVDDQGYAQYQYVNDQSAASVTVDVTSTPGEPVMLVPPAPAAEFSRASASAAGGLASGLIAVGALFNPINSFLYQVEVDPACTVAPCNSYVLTKRALRANGALAEADATSAHYPVVLAHNVVNFQVAFRVAVGTGPAYTIRDIEFGHADNALYSDVNTTGTGTPNVGPHRIVGVRFLLAVRSEMADRTEMLPAVAGSAVRARYCMEDAAAKCVSGANYTRVRSVVMEATLNTAGRFLR